MSSDQNQQETYSRLISRAWWHYWSGDYAEMSQSLKASLNQETKHPSNSSSLGESIAGWITHFGRIATSRRHLLAIDSFTDLAEWKALVGSILSLEQQSPLSQHHSSPQANSFVLYRMLGSDLPPRHTVGQTFDNLQFILNHEPPLHHCKKKWIVNKIVDKAQEKKILKLLQNCHQDYIYLPFDEDEYAKVNFDFESFLTPDFLSSKDFERLDDNSKGWALDCPYRPKNIYTIGVNTVRNLVLEEGKQIAEWILAFDGSCFITQSAWEQIAQAANQAQAGAACKHLMIPMARLTNNAQLFDLALLPPAIEEPQIIFHKTSKERFDEDLQYGRFTKVEMFKRLQYPGVWDRWNYKPWEQKQWRISPEAGQWKEAGWVARLFSGHASDVDQSNQGLKVRTQLRQEAVWNFIDRLDEKRFRRRFHADNLLFFNPSTLSQFRARWQQGDAPAQKIVQRLAKLAQQALKHPAYSVAQKAEMPPGGTIQDYLSLSAFNVPDPKRPNAPYVYQDGQRTEETELYSQASHRYDQTRLQRTLDNITVLVLTWYFTQNATYAEQAVKRIRTWFLDPVTRMNPHLKYAQMVKGDRTNLGSRYGIIDTKDLYYFLDAVRLLRQGNAWSDADHQQMKAWCQAFLDWLRHSPQGQAERCAENNHATCYDLQIVALAGFCDDAQTLFKTLEYSKLRIAKHFDPTGKQPQELKRTDTLHYCTFNLQNWTTLAKIAEQVGVDLWHYTAPKGESLAKAFEWLLPYYQQPWPYAQNKAFNLERFLPLYYIAFDAYPSLKNRLPLKQLPPINDISPHPYTGIPSYWVFAFKDIPLSAAYTD